MEKRSPLKEEEEDLPLPPPVVPTNVSPIKAESGSPPSGPQKKKRVPMSRPGFARRGQPIPLLTNHFKVSIGNVDDYFFHYSVRSKVFFFYTEQS